MKAEILADGTMAITAENPTEAYALRCWHSDYPKNNVIQCNWDVKCWPQSTPVSD
jgi:hypothetical protein